MIALPVKTDKENSAVTPVFGKAKWIALAKSETEISTVANPTNSGRILADWMAEQGVKQVIVQSLGANPFLILNRCGIEVYMADAQRTTISEALQALKEGRLTQITPINMGEYLETGHHHGHGNHHGEHGHHHHEGHGEHHGHGGGHHGHGNHHEGGGCGHGHHH